MEYALTITLHLSGTNSISDWNMSSSILVIEIVAGVNVSLVTAARFPVLTFHFIYYFFSLSVWMEGSWSSRRDVFFVCFKFLTLQVIYIKTITKTKTSQVCKLTRWVCSFEFQTCLNLSSQVTRKLNLNRSHYLWTPHPPPSHGQMICPPLPLCHPGVSAQQWVRFWTERSIQLSHLGNRVCLHPFHLSPHSVIILSGTSCSIQTPFWLFCCPPTSIPPTGASSMGTFAVAWHFKSGGMMNRSKEGIREIYE